MPLFWISGESEAYYVNAVLEADSIKGAIEIVEGQLTHRNFTPGEVKELCDSLDVTTLEPNGEVKIYTFTVSYSTL